MKVKRHARGFHLTEVLITLTIISILAAFGTMIYAHHLEHADRMAAVTGLSKMAAAMERFHIEHDTYDGATLDELGFSKPVGRGGYQLVIESASDIDFQLGARPITNATEKDACGELLLNSHGDKRVSGIVTSVHDCWS